MTEGSSQPPAGIDATVPTAARMYDYWLGGHDNFAADRIAALKVAETSPEVPLVAKANRAFLGRAVRYLAGEAGIRQFLDLGTGLPTKGNVHQVAQRDHTGRARGVRGQRPDGAGPRTRAEDRRRHRGHPRRPARPRHDPRPPRDQAADRLQPAARHPVRGRPALRAGPRRARRRGRLRQRRRTRQPPRADTRDRRYGSASLGRRQSGICQERQPGHPADRGKGPRVLRRPGDPRTWPGPRAAVAARRSCSGRTGQELADRRHSPEPDRSRSGTADVEAPQPSSHVAAATWARNRRRRQSTGRPPGSTRPSRPQPGCTTTGWAVTTTSPPTGSQR